MASTQAIRAKGVFAPVLTPFTPALEPDAGRLVEHCRWLLRQGAGLAVFGTNSEANSLSVDEKLRLLDSLLEAGIDPSRMMPGTGCCAIPDSVTLTRKAVQSGCCGVLMLPPFYYKNVSDQGLFQAHAEVIERVADSRLRVYLYHIPQISGVPISFSLLGRLLAAYPGIIAGIKDSSGDWNNTLELLRSFQSASFDVFCGSEAYLLATLRGGGAGCIAATVNVNPLATVTLYERQRDPDADMRQSALVAVRRCFEKLPVIAAMKAAIGHYTNIPDWAIVRPPLISLKAEQTATLVQELEQLHYLMPGA